MTITPVWCSVDGRGVLKQTGAPPAESRLLVEAADMLLPPLITELHRSFHLWQTARLSPGPLTSARVWIDSAGGLAVRFDNGVQPAKLYPVGAQAGLAAWLVLLDKQVETFVVIARARSVWAPGELAGALAFTTPSLLPPALVQQPPDNWQRVAVALAQAIADGPLPGLHTDRHWKA